MKYLLIAVFTYMAFAGAAQTKFPSEKLPYMEHHYKCHFCGRTYTITCFDVDKIKNDQIKKCFGPFANLKKLQAIAKVEYITNSECNGSRNGKHTWNPEPEKDEAVGHMMVTMNKEGECDPVLLDN